MHLLYFDESGSHGPAEQGSNATPCMVVLGVIVDAALLPEVTREFLAFKRRFFPNRFDRGRALSHFLTEIKGNELLQMSRSSSRNKRQTCRRLRVALLDMLHRYGCKIVGRVWVKEPGKSLKPTETYTYAIQDITRHFEHYLVSRRSQGLLVGDARTPRADAQVAHSVFTQKFCAGGDPYPHVLDVPVFAHSENHSLLQIADLVATAVVFPMAASAYGAPEVSVHGSRRYHGIRAAHGAVLTGLQYCYRDEAGARRGGIVVSDPVGRRASSALFAAPDDAAADSGDAPAATAVNT